MTGLFAILGLLWGSFANVVIYRLPEHKSVVFPASRCRSCNRKLSWFENIPLLSFLFLGGKCRTCKSKISWRYPLVELIMGLGFAGLYSWHGLNADLLEHLILFFGLVVVSFIDLDHMILPDVFTLSGIVIGLLGSLINPDRSFWDSLFGVLFGGGILWAISYLYFVFRKQEGMGGGDVKLLAWIGAVLGWQSIPFIVMASCLIGLPVGVVLALNSEKGMQTVIPFGPYLALGAVLYIFGGNEFGQAYIRLFLPDLVH